MLFNEFGNKNNPPILLLHGMMQNWRNVHETLKPLEEHYRLIIPAQDGFMTVAAILRHLLTKQDKLKNISIPTTTERFSVHLVLRRVDLCLPSY